ncbi:MAG: T9SS type A sorting domain-containing protein [Bacteroidota bacterium]
MKLALCLTFMGVMSVCSGQESEGYVIPFASKGNTIELAVENTAAIASSNISVELKSRPSWAIFNREKEVIAELSGQTESKAMFSFSVDRTAPIGQKEKLVFIVSSSNGRTWSKEIVVSVGPPETFELFQNFPNPFNPSTTIAYQLTTDSRVRLKIYNLLGQEVVTLFDGDRPAGFHQEAWNASSVASGTYVYRLIASDAFGKEIMEKKVMTLVK